MQLLKKQEQERVFGLSCLLPSGTRSLSGVEVLREVSWWGQPGWLQIAPQNQALPSSTSWPACLSVSSLGTGWGGSERWPPALGKREVLAISYSDFSHFPFNGRSWVRSLQTLVVWLPSVHQTPNRRKSYKNCFQNICFPLYSIFLTRIFVSKRQVKFRSWFYIIFILKNIME